MSSLLALYGSEYSVPGCARRPACLRRGHALFADGPLPLFYKEPKKADTYFKQISNGKAKTKPALDKVPAGVN